MYIGIADYKLLVLSIVLSFSLTSNVLAQNKAPTNKPKTNSTTTLKVGSTVSGKFVSTFEPAPTVGMRYTFSSSSEGGEYNLPSKVETTEVISMANGYATLLISGSNHEDREKLVKVSEIRSSGVIYVQFRYDGLVDVNVPFSKFKKATKVSVSNKNSDLSLWLVKGIGVVKLVEYDKNTKGKITTELVDFRANKKMSIDNKIY